VATAASSGADTATGAALPVAGLGAELARVDAPVSEPVSRARYAFHPIPEYPERAVREGWEGTVLLEVFIDSSGRPETVSVNRSSGFAVLDQAAREAVKNWRFHPASLGNRQITSSERVPIIFRLDDRK
jgi:protein TonB